MAIVDPREIPDLRCWLSAESPGATYANDAAMIGWTDLSGMGNHGTVGGTAPKWQATTGPNGGASVRFPGVAPSYFQLPDSVLVDGVDMQGEVFFVVKVDAGSGTTSGLHTLSRTGTSGHRYHATSIEETFGRLVTHGSVQQPPSPATTSWRRYNVRASKGGIWQNSLDEVVQDSEAQNWDPYWTTGRPKVIGAGFRGVDYNLNNSSLLGNISLVLVFARVLTSTERADVVAWMQANPSGGTTGTPPGSLVGVLPGLEGSFAATHVAPPATSTLAGTLPRLAGSFAGTSDAPAEATLAGTLSKLSGSFAGTQTAAPVQTGTLTTNRANGIQVRGMGYVENEPAVVEPPATLRRGHSYVKAFAYTAPTVTDGRVVLDPTWVEAKAHRNRIVVGGKDVTFFRDVPTPQPGYRLTQPLGYGATTLVFPQTHAAFEQFGAGALKWLDHNKGVRFQRVDVDTKERVGDYIGVITAVRMVKVGDKLCWAADVGGDLSGRAALRDVQPPLFRWTRDLGRRAFNAVVELNARFTPRLGPTTGIKIAGVGGMSHLDYLHHICAMGVKINGDQYTLMPTATKPRVYEYRLKDTTTRHATVYFDSGNIVPDLVDDLAERPNMIYGTGYTPEGMYVKNGIYPGLKQGAAAPYPMAAGASFGVGTTDADTINGDGITVMAWKLIGTEYLSREDLGATYTQTMAEAVEALQDDASLPQTGTMDTDTWDALFNVTATGYSLRHSKVMPLARRAYTRKWRRTGDGSRASKNPNHDPTRLEVHRTIQYGTGFEKPAMRRFARLEINRNTGKSWVGTIRVNTGAVIRGNHTPGAPLTSADVMPLRELRPGMNVWAPLFDGGTLFHIVGIDVDEGGRTGTLTVDTKSRDLLSVAEIIQRNRDSRDDPARAYLTQNRSSKRVKDSIIPFDEVGGLVHTRVECPANTWTVFPVVAGQEGTIGRIELQTSDDPAAFSLSVWGRNPGEENLKNKIPTPLAIDDDGGTVWDEDRDVFDSKLLLYAAGTKEQPCGYWPKRHTNDRGETTAHPVTGKWIDDASFGYHTGPHPVLYVAIWPTTATTIKPQRMMWPQLEAGA